MFDRGSAQGDGHADLGRTTIGGHELRAQNAGPVDTARGRRGNTKGIQAVADRFITGHGRRSDRADMGCHGIEASDLDCPGVVWTGRRGAPLDRLCGGGVA